MINIIIVAYTNVNIHAASTAAIANVTMRIIVLLHGLLTNVSGLLHSLETSPYNDLL